jgi:hypothetical protein
METANAIVTEPREATAVDDRSSSRRGRQVTRNVLGRIAAALNEMTLADKAAAGDARLFLIPSEVNRNYALARRTVNLHDQDEMARLAAVAVAQVAAEFEERDAEPGEIARATASALLALMAAEVRA